MNKLCFAAHNKHLREKVNPETVRFHPLGVFMILTDLHCYLFSLGDTHLRPSPFVRYLQDQRSPS